MPISLSSHLAPFTASDWPMESKPEDKEASDVLQVEEMDSRSGAWGGEVMENIPGYAHHIFPSSADRTKQLSHSQFA